MSETDFASEKNRVDECSTRVVVRHKLTLAYRGTRFHGWQAQKAAATWKGELPPGGLLRPVQSVLASAVGEVVGHPVGVVGASRTDAGVHAKGQVCHFDTTATHIPPRGLLRAVNARLPPDVVIRELGPVHADFDAISDAVHKRYQYVVWNSEIRNVFKEDLAFFRWRPIEVEPMREAARHLVGRHDFASFARPGHMRRSTVRTLTACDVSARGPLIVIGVSGTGFLWNQVRIIAGTLLEVGMGRYTPGDVARMLAACDRRVAGSTAPPEGLYLQWIQHKPWYRPIASADAAAEGDEEGVDDATEVAANSPDPSVLSGDAGSTGDTGATGDAAPSDDAGPTGDGGTRS